MTVLPTLMTISAERSQAPRAATAASTMTIRILAVVCADDDGSGATYTSERIAARIAGVNQIWKPAGVQFAFDPAKDRVDVKSTLLGEDTTPGDPGRNARARSQYAAARYGRLVIFFRDWKVDADDEPLPTMASYGFSGGGDFAALAKGDEISHLAHELGHHLGLDHTFGGVQLLVSPALAETTNWAAWEKDLRAQQVTRIRDHVASLGGDKARGLEVFDGDRWSGVLDTPPDDGGQILHAINGGNGNGPIGELVIEVDFGDGAPPTLYKLAPDRRNVMSYFGVAPTRVSADQGRVARAGLTNGNRRHLILGKARGDDPISQLELRPTALSWGPGHAFVAARGERGQVYTKVWDGDRGNWWPGPTAWLDIGGDTVGSPAAASWGPGRLDLVATGADGRVRNKVWEADRGDWWPGRTDWADLGGGAVGPPAMLTWGPGHMFVAALGRDGDILTKTWDADRGGWWPGDTEWHSVGGRMAAAPSLVSWAPGRVDMVAVGRDGRVYNKVWEAERGDWWPGRTDWADLGGSVIAPATAVSWGPGRLDVFARGRNGRIFNKVWEAERGGWWPGEKEWEDCGTPPESGGTAGGATLSAPAVIAREPGVLDLVARANDGTLHNKVWSASGWWPGQHAWSAIGTAEQATGAPVVLSDAPGRLQVLTRAIGGSVLQKSWDHTTSVWHPGQHGWESLGQPWT